MGRQPRWILHFDKATNEAGHEGRELPASDRMDGWGPNRHRSVQLFACTAVTNSSKSCRSQVMPSRRRQIR